MKKSRTSPVAFLKLNMLLALSCISLACVGQQAVYEIYAVEFAGPLKMSGRNAAVGGNRTDSVKVGYFVWLLRGNNGRTVLVDAGWTDTTTHLRAPNYIRPDQALLTINVKPADITDLIITHPHPDHIGGIDLFPNAQLWIQKDDYDYFVGEGWQQKDARTGLIKEDVLRLVNKNLAGKLTFVKGDSIEIIPGIRVFIGSRHTWQSQYLLVNGTSGKTLVASDGIWFYYNLEHLLPVPTYTYDEKAYVSAMQRMKTLVDRQDLIIPGHDALVLERFPKVADRAVKIEVEGK
jgi:glyoxylase-like metal-dependent hydrolase (beta-lactamase superfamily II)